MWNGGEIQFVHGDMEFGLQQSGGAHLILFHNSNRGI